MVRSGSTSKPPLACCPLQLPSLATDVLIYASTDPPPPHARPLAAHGRGARPSAPDGRHRRPELPDVPGQALHEAARAADPARAAVGLVPQPVLHDLPG